MSCFFDYELENLESKIYDDLNAPYNFKKTWEMIKIEKFNENYQVGDVFIKIPVAFIAYISKFELIKLVVKYHSISIDSDIINKMDKVINESITYIKENDKALKMYIKKNVEEILDRLKIKIKVKMIFSEPFDLNMLCNFLDALELFTIGYQRYLHEDIRNTFKPYVEELKKYILFELGPYYIREYGKDAQAFFKIFTMLGHDIYKPWLPMTFWWRHLPYLFYQVQREKEE